MNDESQYPRGRLNENDEGALQLALMIQGGHVILHFGKPITWLGLGKQDVLTLILGLEQCVEHAEDLPQEALVNANFVEPEVLTENNTVRINLRTLAHHVCMTPAGARRLIDQSARQTPPFRAGKDSAGAESASM